MSFTRQEAYNETVAYQGTILMDTPEIIGRVVFLDSKWVSIFYLKNDTVYKRVDAFWEDRKEFEKTCEKHISRGRKVTNRYTEGDFEIVEFWDGALLIAYDEKGGYYMLIYDCKEYTRLNDEE